MKKICMAWKIDKEDVWHALPPPLHSTLPSSHSQSPSLQLAESATTPGIVVDDLLLLVLPGERPRRLEVQTLLVALVVVGTATGQLELLLVLLVLLELLATDATAAAAAASTTDATTFKLCLDVNCGGVTEKLHRKRNVILHEFLECGAVWDCVFCFSSIFCCCFCY